MIKELAEKSGLGWDDKYHWYVGNEQLKKYTELVIKECMAICDDIEQDNTLSAVKSTFKDGAFLCKVEIAEKFNIDW